MRPVRDGHFAFVTGMPIPERSLADGHQPSVLFRAPLRRRERAAHHARCRRRRRRPGRKDRFAQVGANLQSALRASVPEVAGGLRGVPSIPHHRYAVAKGPLQPVVLLEVATAHDDGGHEYSRLSKLLMVLPFDRHRAGDRSKSAMNLPGLSPRWRVQDLRSFLQSRRSFGKFRSTRICL
jgi:hypothetical protein